MGATRANSGKSIHEFLVILRTSRGWFLHQLLGSIRNRNILCVRVPLGRFVPRSSTVYNSVKRISRLLKTLWKTPLADVNLDTEKCKDEKVEGRWK